MSESMTNQEKIIAEKNEAIDRMAHNAMKDAATIVRLLALLKRMELSAIIPYHIPACPICGQSQDDGHTADCELAKEIDSG